MGLLSRTTYRSEIQDFAFDLIRDQLNEPAMTFLEKKPSRRQIFETIIYGMYAHRNRNNDYIVRNIFSADSSQMLQEIADVWRELLLFKKIKVKTVYDRIPKEFSIFESDIDKSLAYSQINKLSASSPVELGQEMKIDSSKEDHDLLEQAVNKAKEQYQSDQKLSTIEKEAKYGSLFNPQNLDNLSAADFKSFLLYGSGSKEWIFFQFSVIISFIS